MNRILTAVVALAPLLAAGAAPARAETGWHLTFQAGPGNQVSEIRMSGANLRAGEAGSGREVIVGGDAFTVLDHRAKSYTVVTFAQIENTVLPMMKAIKDAAASQRKQLEGALDQLSPEERAKAEAQLDRMKDGDDGGTSTVSLEGTGDTGKVAGLAARKMLAVQDGKPVAEVWVTDAIPTKTLRSLMDRFVDMVTQVAPPEEQGFLKAWPDLEGFPVRVVDLTGDAPREVLLLTAAEPVDLPASTFQPPADYTKSALGLGAMGGMGGQ